MSNFTIQLEQSDLMAVLNKVSLALPAKTNKPAFEGIFIQSASDGRISFHAENDEHLAVTDTIQQMIGEEGTAVVPGKMFQEICRKLPAGEVKLAFDDRAVKITAGKAKVNLALIAESYPLTTMDTTNGISIKFPSGEFKKALAMVGVCIGHDEARQVLTGMKMAVKNGIAAIVCLDGFRMGLYKIKADSEKDANAIVPGTTLNALQKILPDNGDVEVTVLPTATMYKVNSTLLTSTSLQGDYPDYNAILPTSFKTQVRIENTAELNEACNRAQIIARDAKNSLLKFDFNDDGIIIEANGTSSGANSNISESVSADMIGEGMRIAFNEKYITQACRGMDSDSIVLNLNTPLTPMVITSPESDDKLYLVLPVRESTSM